MMQNNEIVNDLSSLIRRLEQKSCFLRAELEELAHQFEKFDKESDVDAVLKDNVRAILNSVLNARSLQTLPRRTNLNNNLVPLDEESENLAELPIEIWCKIISYLELPQQLQICKTSKLLRSAARNIQLSDDYLICNNQQHIINLKKFKESKGQAKLNLGKVLEIVFTIYRDAAVITDLKETITNQATNDTYNNLDHQRVIFISVCILTCTILALILFMAVPNSIANYNNVITSSLLSLIAVGGFVSASICFKKNIFSCTAAFFNRRRAIKPTQDFLANFERNNIIPSFV